MTDLRDSRYKEFLALFEEEVHTAKERTLAAYQVLFPGLELEVDKHYRAIKGNPATAQSAPTGPVAWVRRHPLVVVTVLGLMVAGVFEARALLAERTRNAALSRALYKHFADADLSPRDKRVLDFLVPEALHGALELDPLEARAWNVVVDDVNSHDPTPDGALELYYPRAVTAETRPVFRFEQPDPELPFRLTIRGDEDEQSFELKSGRAPVLTFVLPEGSSLQPGSYVWSVEVDYELIEPEDHELAREMAPTPNQLTFRVASKAELDALPSLTKPTDVAPLNTYFHAWALVEHGFAQRAEHELTATPPTGTKKTFQGEARWRYLRARALAQLDEGEEAMLLFRMISDPDAQNLLPGEGLFNLKVGPAKIKPKRRGKKGKAKRRPPRRVRRRRRD